MDQLVALEGVAARAGGTPILREVHLTLGSGEAVGLFGSNGSGKTTLLRLIATLVPPSAGKAVVLGADLAGPDRFEIRPRIGMVGHVPGLFPELTLRENLAFAATIAGRPAGAAGEALAAVGLGGAADRPAAACSHGMQRRAEFARLLITHPDLVLLDEPHAALDRDAAELVSHIVVDVRTRGGAAVLVSHDRDRVEAMVDRTIELRGGTVAQ